MNPVIAQLTLRSLLGRRRAILLALLPLILLLLASLFRLASRPDDQLAVYLLGGFALAALVPLLGLIAGTGAIGPEIDDGSIGYLLAKPVPRWTIATTKFVIASGVVALFAAVPTAAAGWVVAGELGSVALSYAVGVLVASVAYSALFLLLAVLTRSAVVIGLIYALLWETLIGNLVPGAQALSVQQWSLAITQRLLGDEADSFAIDAAVSFGTGAVLLIVVTAFSVWYAAFRLRRLRLTSES